MGFALQLKDALEHREGQARREVEQGEALEVILSRYLLAIEGAHEADMRTSILLLEDTQLRHGAAPNLPASYRDAIDGSKIGPKAGSCGTAAYRGEPVYVIDIAIDPLWEDYRDLALKHGLRACWSTPIRDSSRHLVGTFAIYYLTPRSPKDDEVKSIQTITRYVARAIILAREEGNVERHGSEPKKPSLELVRNQQHRQLHEVGESFDKVAAVIERTLAELNRLDPLESDIDGLRRPKAAAVRGALLAKIARSPKPSITRIFRRKPRTAD